MALSAFGPCEVLAICLPSLLEPEARMMRSFFFKMFGWFWLANMLLSIGIGVTISLTRTPFDRLRIEDEATVQTVAQELIRAYEVGGRAALGNVMSHYQNEDSIEAWLYKETDIPLAGEKPPADTLVLIPAVRQSGIAQEFPSTGIPGRWYVLPEPGGYLIAARMPMPGVMRRLLNADILQVQLLYAMVVAGGVSFLLARHLNAPINALRQATQRVARGELNTRVAAEVKKGFGDINALASDFDRMTARIDALLEGQKRLMRDISHELRSPLARLSVALELARQQAGDGAEKSLDRIAREADRLNELIGQLLTLTSLESGEKRLSLHTLELHSLLEELVADADFEARAKGCAVRLQSAGPVYVQGEAELLCRAIENVLRNAIRHSSADSTVVVTLATGPGPGQLPRSTTIRVQDSGPGVPEDQLEHIFEPFYRVVAARDRQSGGTGIGLAIASRAVRLHGGTVKARNAAEGGLIIEIDLPTVLATTGENELA